MRRKEIGIRGVVWAMGAAMLGTASAGDGGYTLARSTMRPGGHRSTGDAFELSGTIGQPGTTKQTGGAFEMSAGFQVPFAATDCNGDHRVNLLDASAFEVCMTSPAGDPPVGLCICFDVNGSGGVDLADFAELQNEFDGVP